MLAILMCMGNMCDENVVSHYCYSIFNRWQVYNLAVTESTLQMVRQWCRIFSNPERFFKRVKGPEKVLLEFFVARPVWLLCACVCAYA